MSDSNASPGNGANKTKVRNLPSWMSSREKVNKSDGKKLAYGGVHEESNEGETPKQAKGHGKAHTGKTPSKENESRGNSSASNLGATKFSKLLEGVVFVLSGFVNPERGVLRSQALEMGAEYQADWNSDCTLLVCAFPNTPKFRQVEADCGTIVSKIATLHLRLFTHILKIVNAKHVQKIGKLGGLTWYSAFFEKSSPEWISECYNQKTLVDIESFLMHVGRPWRRQSVSHETNQDKEPLASTKSQKQVEREAHLKPTTASSSKVKQSATSNLAKDCFSPSKVKKWAIDDLNKTISWLESQEEKPGPSEIKKIAAEGILTCLQDAIDSLKQSEDIRQVTEQWNFIPRVVEELSKLEGTGDGSAALPRKDLYRQAMACKQIYEVELGNLDDSLAKNKKPRTGESESRANKRSEVPASDAPAYDSDETIEMTEEEVDQAYNIVASTMCKC